VIIAVRDGYLGLRDHTTHSGAGGSLAIIFMEMLALLGRHVKSDWQIVKKERRDTKFRFLNSRSSELEGQGVGDEQRETRLRGDQNVRGYVLLATSSLNRIVVLFGI
jgi:hypothetical protein